MNHTAGSYSAWLTNLVTTRCTSRWSRSRSWVACPSPSSAGPRTTLWGLLVIKFEILIQLSPAFVLGTLHERGDRAAFGGRDILAGIVAGLAVTLALYASGHQNVHGLHAGTAGVSINYLVVVMSRWLRATAGRPNYL